MKKLFVFIVALLVCVVTLSAQQMPPMPPVPMDSAIRYGKLDNGLTYYIRHNNWPEKRVSFYIAQRVGSIQEEESQRGLAHFLEHMAFNGSTHFAPDQLLAWTRSKGVAFGRELNAYTSTDRTVYNINNVSTEQGEAVVDSFLLILYDWANGLTLDSAEIDKERGVIHEEWRLRSSASQRMLQRDLPRLYPGSKYAERLPIGLMSVVDSFKYQELRDYYEKWYNPENQALVIVGDIDVDHMEQQVKALFSGIQAPADAGKVVDETVPDTGNPIVVVDQDKEQSAPMVEFMLKHDVLPWEMRSTMMGLMQQYLTQSTSWMLGERLSELQKKSDCPYAMAVAYDDDSYILSNTKGSYELYARPKTPEQTAQTLQVLVQEFRRATEFGFTETEYERFKADLATRYKNAVDNKDKRESVELAEQYCQNYLQNIPIPDVETEAQIMEQLSQMVPLQNINGYMQLAYGKLDSNVVVLSFQPEKEGLKIPTEEELRAALAAGEAAEVTAYAEKLNPKPLMPKQPKAGKLIRQQPLPDLEATELEYKNGVKVILKHTDFKADQVLVYGWADGGEGLYDESDFANLQLYSYVLYQSGLGNYNRTDLNKYLAGKSAYVQMDMDGTHAVVQGECAPRDMETQLQLIYLSMTQVKKDEESFQSACGSIRSQLLNAEAQPQFTLQDSVSAVFSNRSWRQRNLKSADMDRISYDRILEMAREQSQHGRYTFLIVGNYDSTTIGQLMAQYLGALPKAKQKGAAYKNTMSLAPASIENRFQRKMETPKVTSYLALQDTVMPLTEQNIVLVKVTGELLAKYYLRVIREEKGAAYSPHAVGRCTEARGRHYLRILGVCDYNPDMKDLVLQLMHEGLETLTETVSESDLQDTKDNLSKIYEQNMKTNSKWVDLIEKLEQGQADDRGFGEALKQVTAEQVKAFVKQMMQEGQLLEVTMMPE